MIEGVGVKTWEIDSRQFYVGGRDGQYDRCLLGPFVKPEWAELCIPRVVEIAPFLDGLPESIDREALEDQRQARWLHVQGELNPLFPDLLFNPYREVADTVVYWRSEHSPELVRWVAFPSHEPAAIVGRGTTRWNPAREMAADVRSRLAKLDPIQADSIATWTLGSSDAYEGPAHTPLRTVSVAALRIQVGMTVLDPSDGVAKAVTYRRRHRLADEAIHRIDLSFDQFRPLRNRLDIPEMSRVEVLDELGVALDIRSGAPRPYDFLYRKAKVAKPKIVSPDQPSFGIGGMGP